MTAESVFGDVEKATEGRIAKEGKNVPRRSLGQVKHR